MEPTPITETVVPAPTAAEAESAPPGGQSTTTVTQSGTMAEPTPWLSTHLSNFLALVLTLSVVYLAYLGDAQAQAALISGFSMLTGLILGSRLSLKIPGKDS